MRELEKPLENSITTISGQTSIGKENVHMKKLLVIICGPSGVGKDFIQNKLHFKLLTKEFPVYNLKKYTTRKSRPQEILASYYYYLNPNLFKILKGLGVISCIHYSYGNAYAIESNFCSDYQSGIILYNISQIEIVPQIVTEAELKGISVLKILLTADTEMLFHRISQRPSSNEEKIIRREATRLQADKIRMELKSLRNYFDLVVDNTESNINQTLNAISDLIIKKVLFQ